jgi:hypothetical protein
MKGQISVVGLLLLLVYAPSAAIDLEFSPLELEVQAVRHTGDDPALSAQVEPTGDDYFDFEFDEDESIYEYDYKSPKKAFIYSLLIPGWGQRYTKSSTLKTLGFLAIEAGMWMGYFKYNNDGTKMTDDYEAFADAHWIEGTEVDSCVGDPAESYRGWLAGNNPDGVCYAETTFTHELPDVRDQQYYEMIGKYDQFRGGWDDYWDSVAFYEEREGEDGPLINISPHRETYNDMRKEANDLLDRANTFIIVSIANHLLSAFDAAISARNYNRGKSKEMWLSVKTEMKKYSATESIPIVRFTAKF